MQRDFDSEGGPHRSEKQYSEANLQRRVQGFSRSACFIWYSANTVANGRQASWSTTYRLIALNAGSLHSLGRADGSYMQRKLSAEKMLRTCWARLL